MDGFANAQPSRHVHRGFRMHSLQAASSANTDLSTTKCSCDSTGYNVRYRRSVRAIPDQFTRKNFH